MEKEKRFITHVDAEKLAIGIQAILLDMKKDGVKEPSFPIARFEQMIQEQHGVSRKEAEKVTEKIIGTGILRWELGSNSIVL